MTDELARAKVNRAKSSYDVSPVDLLRTMALDIERGDLVVDGLVLVWAHRPKDDPWEFGAYRCCMRFDEELVALEMAKQRVIDRWKGDQS